jgi:hypothetical protein
VRTVIKAVGRTGTGLPLLILGLSGENVARLMADEPISFDLAELGLPPTRVVIVGGRTEDAITELLAGFLQKPAGGHDPEAGT